MMKQAANRQIDQNEEKRKFLNGKWSKSEHERFLKGFSAFGRNWSEVQKLVKTRNITQVRSHAQKYFLKSRQQEDDSCQMSIYSESEDIFQEPKNFSTSQSRVQKKKSKLLRQSSPSSQKPVIEVMRKQDKESLLDIFKQAIQQQTLQLENESHQANYQCERAMEMLDRVKMQIKQQEEREKEKRVVYFENIYGSWKVLV